MPHRETLLPQAVDKIIGNTLSSSEREEVLEELEDNFEAHIPDFDAALARIRRSRFANQVDKILTMFERKKLTDCF